MNIYGNTHGLKANQIRRLERLVRRHIPAERIITHDFARHLTELTGETGRQVGVLVDRRGSVTHAMVGDNRSIEMPDWGRIRAGQGRLRGLRCIHTHVGDEPLDRDDLTDLALLRLDAILAVGTDPSGIPGLVYAAALAPPGLDGDPVELLDPTPAALLDFDFRIWIREREEQIARQDRTREVVDGDRAILVSVTAGRSKDVVEDEVRELQELAKSAGVSVVEVVTQRRSRVDPKFVMGQGRLADLVIQAFQSDLDLLIFDQNLSPTQARNLSDRFELRVIDRTQLILDIFAQHAKTRDGKLQVELAQLKYMMPRLSQRDDRSLSRLAGGIGGRGPGETKLEVDRRRVRDRIGRLERELTKLRKQRSQRRSRRTRRSLPVLSIVGYTNAGKSTLLRALTRSEVLVEDKMFATLDPTSRKLRFPREREVIITDTVGFIRDLPPDLVTAFRATLEELSDADLLLHVVDAASSHMEQKIEAVRRVLDEIGLGQTPELLVFNQIDRLPPDLSADICASITHRHGGVAISALQGTGLGDLLARAEELLWLDSPGMMVDPVAKGEFH